MSLQYLVHYRAQPMFSFWGPLCTFAMSTRGRCGASCDVYSLLNMKRLCRHRTDLPATYSECRPIIRMDFCIQASYNRSPWACSHRVDHHHRAPVGSNAINDTAGNVVVHASMWTYLGKSLVTDACGNWSVCAITNPCSDDISTCSVSSTDTLVAFNAIKQTI